MKKYLIALVLLLVGLLVVAGCDTPTPQVGTDKEQPGEESPAVTAPGKEVPLPKIVVEDVYVVEVTNNGFVPRELTIKQGDSVQFVAKDGGRHWPASAVHPTHEVYPGSSIKKCNGPEEDTTFDACMVLSQDSAYEFRFTEAGSWTYHDHIHPALTGTVTVEAKE